MRKLFLPSLQLDTVFEIDADRLWNAGVRAFIFDIDNTLATYALSVPDTEIKGWLDGLKARGFGIYFVSNNSRKRVESFAAAAGVRWISRAAQPIGFQLRRACRKMGVLPKQAALVGDQLFTDIWGGNALGMFTVLVTPISEKEDGFVKFKRRFERKILGKTEYRDRR